MAKISILVADDYKAFATLLAQSFEPYENFKVGIYGQGYAQAGHSGRFLDAKYTVAIVSDGLLNSPALYMLLRNAIDRQEIGFVVFTVVVTTSPLPEVLDKTLKVATDHDDPDVMNVAKTLGTLITQSEDLAKGNLLDTQLRQERVEERLEVRIQPVLIQLKKQEARLRNFSFVFYSTALVSLIAGLVFAVERAHQISGKEPTSWRYLAQFTISGLIIIGMLSAVARFAFILGRSFMVESLTNGDRAHAISFGRFYLEAFGARATWSEVKEAFENWNVDRGASFLAQNASDTDPVILQALVEAAKSIGAAAKK